MELQAHSRKTSESKRLRREGKIPANLYGYGSIAVDAGAYQKALNSIEPGTLSTQVFTLKTEQGDRRAILKEVQYHPSTYAVLHLDFEELQEDKPVCVNVPLKCLNTADCQGVKEGGSVRQTIRTLRVRCLPKHLPSKFHFDVLHLGIGATLKLKDLKIPENVRPLAKMGEVAVVISKK